jgi:hypothetical protein
LDLAYLEALKNDRFFLRGIKVSNGSSELFLNGNETGT